MTMTRRLQILIGLIFPLLATFAPIGAWSKQIFGPLMGGEALWWALVVVMLVYVVAVERLPLSSIGFRKPGIWDILLGILAGVLLFVGVGVIYAIVIPALHLAPQAKAADTLGTILTMPFWFRVLLVARAAVCEEVLFRGYPLERIEELTGSTILAALLTWAAFTYAHLAGWGTVHLIVAGYGGVILTILYLWRRNIWANMIAHWIADGGAFLLMPLLMPHH